MKLIRAENLFNYGFYWQDISFFMGFMLLLLIASN